MNDTPRAARITTILFDAGGTLVFPNFAHIAAQLDAEGLRVDAAALERADPRVRFDLDRRDVVATTSDGDRFHRYLDALARAAGLPGLPTRALERLVHFHRVHNLWDHLPPDVPVALAHLGARFRLGVVSNSNGTVRVKLERLGLARFFEVIVDSQEEKTEKPDARLFALALARMGADAARTAYVGDLYHVDVVGARAAGLVPVLLDPLDLYASHDVARARTLADVERALGVGAS